MGFRRILIQDHICQFFVTIRVVALRFADDIAAMTEVILYYTLHSLHVNCTVNHSTWFPLHAYF